MGKRARKLPDRSLASAHWGMDCVARMEEEDRVLRTGLRTFRGGCSAPSSCTQQEQIFIHACPCPAHIYREAQRLTVRAATVNPRSRQTSRPAPIYAFSVSSTTMMAVCISVICACASYVIRYD